MIKFFWGFLLTLISTTTLLAQNTFAERTAIPYRQKDLWGLADTSGNIIVVPQYDRVHKGIWMQSGVFDVCKNQKCGLIDSNGKVLIPLKYKSIFGAKYIQGYKNRNIYDLYNYKGEKYFDFSLYQDDLLFDNVTLIRYYDNKYNKYLALVLFDFEEQKSSFLLKDYQSIRKQTLKNGKQYILASNETGQNQVFEVYLEDKEVIRIKKSTEDEVSLVMKTIAEENAQILKPISPVQKGSIKKHFIRTSFKIEADKIVQTNIINGINQSINHTKKSHWRYKLTPFLANAAPSRINLHHFKKTMPLLRNFVLITDGNKQGLITEKRVIVPQFSTIKGYCISQYYQSFYIVTTSDGKSGVINADGTWRLPLQSNYELLSFEADADVFIIKKEGKTGVLSHDFNIIIAPKYDNIKSIKTSDDIRQFLLTNADKHGLFMAYCQKNATTDWKSQLIKPFYIAEPIFKEYPSSYITFYNGYKTILLCKDADYIEMLGLADPKGFYYYED